MSREQKSRPALTDSKSGRLVQTAKVVSLALILGLGVSFTLANWTPPPSAPTSCASSEPGCNLPINVSTVSQTKDGNLQVDKLITTDLDFSGEIRPYSAACANGQTIKKNDSTGNWECTNFSPGYWIDEDGSTFTSEITTEIPRDVHIQGHTQLDGDILVNDALGAVGYSCANGQVLVKVGEATANFFPDGRWTCTSYSPSYWDLDTTGYGVADATDIIPNGGGRNINLSHNLFLKNTNAAGTIGMIKFGDNTLADRFLHNYGSAGSASNNVFLGPAAGKIGNNTGTDNIGIGRSTISSNVAGAVSGSFNVGIGSSALSANTTGNFNVGLGHEVLTASTDAVSNVAVGYKAMTSSTGGNDNVAVGRESLQGTGVGGNGNVAVGYETMRDNNTGSENVAVGYTALRSNNSGVGNVAVGSAALGNTAASYNTALGYQALSLSMSASSTAVGVEALKSNTSGVGNVAVGAEALESNSTGYNNTAVGYRALTSLSGTQHNNSAFGHQALASLGNGGVSTHNTALGSNALYNLPAGGNNNTAVGSAALYTATGIESTAVGSQALYSSSGNSNTAVGYNSLRNSTTGTNNVAIGRSAGSRITTGSYNIFIGETATSTTNSSLNYMTAIGYGAHPTQASTMMLGAAGTSPGTGGQVRVGIGVSAPSFQLELSTNSAGKPTSNTWSIVSDKRLKDNIVDFGDGLEVIQKIRPVSYELNGKAGTPKGERGISVIAQEIKDVAPYTVSTYKAKLNQGDSQETELYNFDSSALTFVLINAVKEQQQQIEAQQKEIENLKLKLENY